MVIPNRKNGVFVDDKDAEHREADWLCIQSTYKHVYLQTIQNKCLIAVLRLVTLRPLRKIRPRGVTQNLW